MGSKSFFPNKKVELFGLKYMLGKIMSVQGYSDNDNCFWQDCKDSECSQKLASDLF